MASPSARDSATVVGSGPNGLAAAVELARAGVAVRVLEARATIGGGSRTAELTLPGLHHDVCSTIHPLANASPFFRGLQLENYGLEWIHPTVPVAHPLDDGTAVLLQRSIALTAQGLGADATAYRRLMEPLVGAWEDLVVDLLGPPRPPGNPLAVARFAWSAARSARALANNLFSGERARALFAGLAAHSMLPLDRLPTAGFGLLLGLLGHAVGWPLARGGSQSIVDALAANLRNLGGEIVTETNVKSLAQLTGSGATLFDVTPRQLLAIAGDRLPERYRHQLQRFRYGPGAFKVDWALRGPIPWTATECELAATVHLGGTLEEIARSESAVWRGRSPEQPYVILVQPSLFDPTRAPAGQHAVWAYCHVPAGSSFDMTARIEAQVERFAPGFRDLVLARHALNPIELERYNANNVGGDIGGGVLDLGQFITRPTVRLDPYATPTRGIYLCSSSTPPGAGVHGLCGYFAARSALRREFGR